MIWLEIHYTRDGIRQVISCPDDANSKAFAMGSVLSSGGVITEIREEQPYAMSGLPN